MAEYGNNVHTTGDLRNGYRHVGVVDTVVGGGGLRYQQEQQSVAETAQSRYPPPGAVGDSQDQLNMIESTGVTEPQNGTRMFLNGLGFDTDKARIQEICDAFGDVEHIHIPIVRGTNSNKGFAFVEFRTASELAVGLAALNGAVIDGRKITAVQARPYKIASGAVPPKRKRGSNDDRTRRVPEDNSFEHSSGTVPPPSHHIYSGNDCSSWVPEDRSMRSDHHHGAHRLRTRDRSQSPEMRGLEEYPHKQIHMPRSDCKYDNSIGGGGGNRGSMRENYQNFHYVQQQPQQQQQSVPPSPATQVYVGNLSGRTDFNGLNRLFSRCGRILHIDVKCDQPEIATPHAVITFAFESSVSDAVHFYSETELDGHVIVPYFITPNHNILILPDVAPRFKPNTNEGESPIKPALYPCISCLASTFPIKKCPIHD